MQTHEGLLIAENEKYVKPMRKRMHNNRNMKDKNATKIIYHKIVHSSAMYYQNLNVIHKSSKKLLTIKSVKTNNT